MKEYKMPDQAKVLIVGAGPTGLTAAVVLHRYGIPFRIIDKAIKPVKTSNALAVQVRTLELWDDLGLLPKALEYGHQIKNFYAYVDRKKIAELNLGLLNSEYQFILGLSQQITEKMMLEYLSANHIEVEVETELLDLEEIEQNVTVTLQHKNNTTEKLNVEWLMACDGGHSTVRNKLNIPFKGQELPQHFVLADLELKSELSNNTFYAMSSAAGLLLLAPYSEKNWRIIASVTEDSELFKNKNISFNDIKDLLQKRCAFKLEIGEPFWTSAVWLHARMIETFRHHRIFFAGDAAHVHSPAGGQGMNTGIQDAYNLAWKLSLVIQGKVNPLILDTYTAERQPVAKNILRGTTYLTDIVSLQNPILRMMRNVIMSILLSFKIFQNKVLNTLGELNIHYDNNMLVQDYSAKKIGGPAVGTRMLDVKYGDKRLLDKVRGKEFVVLIFMGIKEDVDLVLFTDVIQMIKRNFTDTIKFILIRTKDDFENSEEDTIFDEDQTIHRRYNANHSCFYLMRPDKYIGAKGDGLSITKLKDYFGDFYLK
jgi:2-polyprenyl-6-methoxyphenol hydroxylase-like FAD-dependent oxidoreductase